MERRPDYLKVHSLLSVLLEDAQSSADVEAIATNAGLDRGLVERLVRIELPRGSGGGRDTLRRLLGGQIVLQGSLRPITSDDITNNRGHIESLEAQLKAARALQDRIRTALLVRDEYQESLRPKPLPPEPVAPVNPATGKPSPEVPEIAQSSEESPSVPESPQEAAVSSASDESSGASDGDSGASGASESADSAISREEVQAIADADADNRAGEAESLEPYTAEDLPPAAAAALRAEAEEGRIPARFVVPQPDLSPFVSTDAGSASETVGGWTPTGETVAIELASGRSIITDVDAANVPPDCFLDISPGLRCSNNADAEDVAAWADRVSEYFGRKVVKAFPHPDGFLRPELEPIV